jgi:hypothetical protein
VTWRPMWPERWARENSLDLLPDRVGRAALPARLYQVKADLIGQLRVAGIN